MTMKTVLLFLLATGLALQPGSALQCYSCEDKVRNSDCRDVQNCTSAERHCYTQLSRAADLVTFISKGCSSSCEEHLQDHFWGMTNITCCSSDLCNVSGARTLKPALATVALLSTLGSLLLWGPEQL